MIKDHFVYSISIYKNFIYICILLLSLTIILPEHALKSQNLTSIVRCIKLKTFNNKKIEKNTSRYNYVHISNQSAQLEN